MYAVILAGGGGTRLWPLSDPQHPKPFLPLFPERRHSSLLQKTVDRLTAGAELGLGESDLTVVTDQRYQDFVRDQAPGVTVLSEPVGRNTAAAIAYAALAVDRDPDETMVVLPADHLVRREDLFRGVLADADRELAHGAFGLDSPLVTLGIQADWPATQYGYLVPDKAQEQVAALHSYVLEEFVEKPDRDHARRLIDQGGTAWNAGIFMARRSAWLDALGKYTDLIGLLDRKVGDPEALAAAYDQIEKSISIDYAVMEPAAADGLVVMAGMDVGWSDVGTWRALLDALVGGYVGAARVVPPTESAALASEDLAVLRTANNRLVLEAGPADLRSAQPIGLLPDARPHAEALTQLLGRVNDSQERVATPVEARA